MTDAPFQLNPGQRFDLAIQIRDALLAKKMDYVDNKHLVGLFEIDLVDTQDDEGYDYVEWTATFIRAPVDRLVGLADYLGVELPLVTQPDATPSATAVDAYTELVAAETALRDVVRLAVPSWHVYLTPEDLEKLDNKRIEEGKKRDGITVSQDLLDYSEIHQLTSLISKNWEAVKPILDDKRRTETYLGIITDVRNTIGHSRPVAPSERLLLAGAAGQIRNQLARYRSSQDGSALHYSSIDAARDRFGTDGDPRIMVLERDSSADDRLDVGEIVTFEVSGTDPRGRELNWSLYVAKDSHIYAYSMTGARAEATGDRATISWEVLRSDVGESTAVAIVLRNSSEFQRDSSGHDDLRLFHYKVNPPID